LDDAEMAYVTAYGTAMCTGLSSCCTQYNPKFDVSACEQGEEALLALGLSGAVTAKPVPMAPVKRQLNAAYASACLAAIPAFVAACGRDPLRGQAPAICDQVFTTTAKPGDACDADAVGACSPPPDGNGRGNCYTGKCEWTYPAAAGDSCDHANPLHVGECDATVGAMCALDTNKCVAPQNGGSGQPCRPCQDTASCEMPCDSGLVCDKGDSICVVPGSVGTACHSNGCENCDGTVCGDGLACHTLMKVCVPAAQLGGTCEYSDCAPNLYCESSDWLCIAKGKTGDACGGNSPPCAAGADACNNGVCVAVDEPGAPCPSGVCPSGYYCAPNVNVCSPIGRTGEPCRGNDGCVPGDFCDCADLECVNPGVCEPKVENGEPCPARIDDQCAEGSCWNVNLAGTLRGETPNFVCVPDDLPVLCLSNFSATSK
jgi:hypothetical protein